MFEIKPEDVGQLDDKQLRTLVALLCESELRSRGYSSVAVTWGGDQNAEDGGIDVRVRLEQDGRIDGFIPRRSTGFQVKAEDMQPREIDREMCPKGELRASIRELGADGGAYIIVSSKGSVSDTSLTRRLNAMDAALVYLDEKPKIDFYDRTRIASWVRSHAGLVLWVRQAVGRSIQGWEPFGAWAFPGGGTKAEYLLDTGLRIRNRTARDGDELSAEEGLKRLRGILKETGSVVRLVGLSGVGKTRLVQALFDDRIGQDALNPALAVYANINNEPVPSPFTLASNLIASGTPAILIVDNCASDLHSRLANLVKGTVVSVLTVEYDIQDDLPEATDVFELRAASTELIEQLLNQRFSYLSQVDRRTAAEFSGGNARIAIALADTVGRGGTLAKLNDQQLFERLFSQRQSHDRSLVEMAQACALVYSFDGEDLSDGAEAELIRIASIVGAKVESAYSAVAELKRRDLAQQRGKWRAILPHAIANRLAALALQQIPLAHIEQWLVNDAPKRLTISFARRLGYLDSSDEARSIVSRWLEPNGWIGKHVWSLNEFGKSVFQNALPSAPEVGLSALEANLPPHDENTPITTGEYVARFLRSLAWDAALFDRCIKLIQVLAVFGEGRIAKEAADIHKSLFYIFLSGTHATVEQRAGVVRNLLASSNEIERKLGTEALDAMFECDHFSSLYEFQFGAHSRDYGYQPRFGADIKRWYQVAFRVAEDCVLSKGPSSSTVKKNIGNQFRGLWSQAGIRNELEAFARKIILQEFWAEAWDGVKTARHYDFKDKASADYARLSELERLLRPRDLIGRALAVVFSNRIYDVDDLASDDPQKFRFALERQQTEAKSLGIEVANDDAAFDRLLPEMVLRDRSNVSAFAAGLAEGTTYPRRVWQRLKDAFSASSKEARDTRGLCGFLAGLAGADESKVALASELLDDALYNEPLAPHFPILQAAVPITATGMSRLRRSVELRKAPLFVYSNIFFGRVGDIVPASELAAYVTAIAEAPKGDIVAADILRMHFWSDRQDARSHAPALIQAGRSLLANLTFDHQRHDHDLHLKEVVEVCAAGPDGYGVARDACLRLKHAVSEHRTSRFGHDNFLRALFKVQPKATLDAILGGDERSIKTGIGLISHSGHVGQDPMGEISEAALFEWCAEDPLNRFPLVAAVVPAFSLSVERTPTGWSSIARRLVHSAPDPLAVMREFVRRLRPMSWSGSRSAILRANANLLGEFDTQGNVELTAFLAAQRAILDEEAKEDAAWEAKNDRERHQKFE